MKEILSNLALIDTLNYCKQNNIDCSGTHIYKYPTRQTYALIKDETGAALVTVTFYKNRVPSHFVHSK